MRAAPIILFVLAVPVAAQAASAEPVAVRLQLDASPECATREELIARVRARSDRIRFEDAAPIAVHAQLAPRPGTRGITGELSVAQPDGRATSRRLVARSCEQATDGLALILVLALDPAALTAGPAPAPPKPPPVARAAPPPVPVAPPPATAVAPPAPPTGARPAGAVEAGARLLFGPAPRPMPALTLAARVTRDRAGLLSPALILSFIHAWSGALTEPGGTATFQLEAAQLDACALRLVVRALEVRGCASGFAGRLAAAGSNTYSPASARRPLAAAGASLLVDAALTRRLQVGGRLEADGALIRDQFSFSPSVFYRAAALIVSAGISVGLRFP